MTTTSKVSAVGTTSRERADRLLPNGEPIVDPIGRRTRSEPAHRPRLLLLLLLVLLALARFDLLRLADTSLLVQRQRVACRARGHPGLRPHAPDLDPGLDRRRRRSGEDAAQRLDVVVVAPVADLHVSDPDLLLVRRVERQPAEAGDGRLEPGVGLDVDDVAVLDIG